MRWKSGQEFVRQVYTPLSGPNVRLLEQADRMSSTTPEPGISASPKLQHKPSVRMFIFDTHLPAMQKFYYTCFLLSVTMLSTRTLILGKVNCTLFLYQRVTRNIYFSFQLRRVIKLDACFTSLSRSSRKYF